MIENLIGNVAENIQSPEFWIVGFWLQGGIVMAGSLAAALGATRTEFERFPTLPNGVETLRWFGARTAPYWAASSLGGVEGVQCDALRRAILHRHYVAISIVSVFRDG